VSHTRRPLPPAHDPEVAGSNPVPATKKVGQNKGLSASALGSLLVAPPLPSELDGHGSVARVMFGLLDARLIQHNMCIDRDVVVRRAV